MDPLRDIHGIDPAPWWPPAPGWWATAALVLGQGGQTVAVKLAPLDLVHITRDTLRYKVKKYNITY